MDRFRVGLSARGVWRVLREERLPSTSLPIGSIVVPFWALPYRILNIDHKKELLWSLSVVMFSLGT